MTLAQVLGWCVELVRASRVVVDDTVAIDTNTSNINRPFSYKSKLGAAAKASKKLNENFDWTRALQFISKPNRSPIFEAHPNQRPYTEKWGTKHTLGSRAFADAMVLDNS